MRGEIPARLWFQALSHQTAMIGTCSPAACRSGPGVLCVCVVFREWLYMQGIDLPCIHGHSRNTTHTHKNARPTPARDP